VSKPVERRLMTPDEMQAVEAMHPVTYPAASWDKRFMRNVSSGEMITEKESAQLWRLFIKYRRQVYSGAKLKLMDLAVRHAAPDLRKVNAAMREQARINKMREEQ
jgi:hypothetical protein